jgi:HEAT repeat protein
MTKNRPRSQLPRECKLQKTLAYISDIERFLDETDTAVPLLIQVYKTAAADLKDEIIFLLGNFATRPVSAWLYTVMTDPGEQESARHNAALQMSVTAALMENPEALSDKLLVDQEKPDPVLRRLAAVALGGAGHPRAATECNTRGGAEGSVVRKNAAAALIKHRAK